MNRSLVLLALLSLGCATSPRQTPPAAPAAVAAADTPTVAQTALTVARDSATYAAIIREGMTRSHVAQDLEYLTDVIGPRVTGTAAMRRANDWTAERFRAYGMDSTWLEPWQFGRSWERGPLTLTMLAPHRRQLIGASLAWAPGTNGPVTGEVVHVDVQSPEEFRTRYAGKLKGKWVVTLPPVPMWNPDGPAMTARDSAVLDSVRRARNAPPPPQVAEFRRQLPALFAAEGAAGWIREGAKEFGLFTMTGSPLSPFPLPQIIVAHDTYAMFHRLLARGETVRLEANIVNTLSRDSVTSFNTVAEIRGSERPDEVVLLGAHLDSWDLGTGATDNATGSIAVLEAARILKAAGVRPRRTIRFALFSGEEQGLIGARRYAETHAAALDRHQAVMVLDNGTGRIVGMSLQGRNELHDLWRQLFARVADLGPFTLRQREKRGTDHLAFIPYGVPAFNYDQEPRGYGHTHHSQIDTFDHVVLGDVQQAATVMAATALGLANLDVLLPRGPKREQ